MKKKAVWITLGILLIIIIALYRYLGGFHDVKMEVVELEEYHLMGNYYEGKYDRDSIAVLFFDAKALLETNKFPGILSVINYEIEGNSVNEEDNGDSVKTFVGLIVQDKPENIPDKYEYRHIKAGRILRASIEANSLVMPTRTTVEGKMKEFAQNNKFLLKPVFIEKYISDNQLIIESIVAP